MLGGCSSAATSFCKPNGADFRICPPVTQFRAFRFLGCYGGGGDSAPSRLNLSPLVCLGRNPIRSAASSPIQPSDSQELLEPTLKDRPQLPDRDDNSKTVCIKIQLQKECKFGEQFFVVGGQPELGMWNPLDAIPMTWSEGHVWTTAQLDIPLGDPVHFKFILRKNNGEFLWQPGEDRVFNTRESADTISVFQEWEDENAEQIAEDSIVDNKYEESLTLKTEQLKISDGKYNEEQDLVVETNQDTVTIVAENIYGPADSNMDVVKNEGEMSGVQGDFLDDQVLDENIISYTMKDEVANEQVPVLVPGLNPCLTIKTENVSAKKEQMKVEPDIDPLEPELDQMQDEAKMKEHPDGVASDGDEDVVYDNQDQDLESALYDGQSNNASSCWRDDDNWGLKRFFNHLGFL